MGKKKPTSGTSKKNVKSAPTWREKLAEYDINKIYEGRTCEIILMAELTISYTEAIILFHNGAKNNPTNVVKSINFESLISDVKQPKQGQAKGKPDKKSKSKGDPTLALHQSAATEALQFLNTAQAIPLELMAQLLKLKIISMINEDVTLRDEERIAEIEKIKLANQASEKKEKGKGKDEKKAKGKGKGKTAIKLPIEERQLFFLITGLYQPLIVQELFNIGIKLSAILELASPECIAFKRKFAARSDQSPTSSIRGLQTSLISNDVNNVDEDDDEVVLFINQYYTGSKESVCYSAFAGEQSISSITSSIQGKIMELNNFWDTIMKGIEGELQDKCLESAAHIRLNPATATEKNPQEVFLEITKEILKIPDVKRQHLNYLRNLKICEVDLKPKNKPVRFWKKYNELMDVVPLDSFTTGLLLHCLVEEVCGRVPDPKPPQRTKFKPPTEEKKNSILPETLDVQKEIFIESEVETIIDNEKSLKELANYVKQYRKTYARGRCGITYRQNKFDVKTKLKLSKKPFIIHESNNLEYKLNTYQELSKKLLNLNINILSKSPTTLLWNLYPQLETIEVVYKNHQLETWRKMLNLSGDEIQSALSAIQFDLLKCEGPRKDNKPKTNLHCLFPKKNDTDILNDAKPNIKYIQTPEISLATLNEVESCLRIPEIPYSNFPNIYEAKNIQTYLWYEKLPRKVMVQELQKANFDYLCIDHKYCPYTDALILRYHNDVDQFGINSIVWTESLRTPVCFRDFCKYIIHNEAQWLEREEDNYQEKLKLKKKNPEPPVDPEVPVDTKVPEEIKKVDSIKKLSQYCAKPEEPFNFFAYDIGEAQIQLTGATTTFQSMDGYKITIDRTTLIGKPENLSLNVSIANHNYILHYNKGNLNEPFTFHFSLSDDTILVFTKPTKTKLPEISMAEKSKLFKTKTKLDPNSVYQPREKKYYFVSEIKRWYLKSFDVPTIVRKNSVVDDLFMAEFSKQMKKNNSGRVKKRRKRKLRKCNNPKCYETKEKSRENSKEVVTLFVSPTVEEEKDLTTKSQAELTSVLKKIEEAKKFQIPMFKVFSSKLHKFEYIKRIKSFLHIKVGKHTISLPCKHPIYKTIRNVEIVKVFPIKLTDSIFCHRNCYDFKISSPSGLLLYTLPGINNQAFNIRQKYVEKNPYCKNITHEDSRSFMRNGYVVVKNSDGTLDILSASGEIIHCEIPHSTIQTHTKYKLKTNQIESRLFRIVNWRRRHIIRSSEARYFKYRRINLRQIKKSKQIYLMQGSNPLIEFTLLTHDGKKLKVTNTNIKKEFYQTTHTYQYYEDHINLRDDGTTNLTSDLGTLITQFKDKTKISSWFAESQEQILIEDEEDEDILFMESMSSLFYEQIINNGWVLIQMFYKFEHPNYATILFSGDNNETEVIFPNNVVVNVTEYGHYFLNVDENFSSVINEELVYLESKSCDVCMQRSITVVNIQPLYDGIFPIEENTELLKTCDSYEKIFLVNYNGKCFRNSNYVKYRTNRSECPYHDKENHQQLFVLNRDLSGNKFWDIKAYRKRIVEATDNNNTVLQYYGRNIISGDYSSLELRTYKYKPYHMHFINQHLINNLIFKGYNNERNPPLLAYTTLCHVYSMPKECMKKLLEAFMAENNKKGVEFPKPDTKDTLCRCVSQIERENIKLKGKSVFDEHLKKISSALLLLKKWYTWHEFHKPYAPPTESQLCKCKPVPQQPEPFEISQIIQISHESLQEKQYTSLEIIPDRVDTNSSGILPTPKPLYKAVCECKPSVNFICECKPSKESKYFPLETETEPEINLAAQQRISSIQGWSDQVDFLEDFYVFAEDAVSDMGGASVSDTVIQPVKPPPCKCNEKKLNQRPLAPKHRTKKICTDTTCDKKNSTSSIKESNTTLINNSYKRQAGGADNPIKYTKERPIPKTEYLEKSFILKQLKKRVFEMVLAASPSDKQAEHYKVAVGIDIISNISRAQLTTSDLLNFLNKLNDLDMNKYKMLSAERLSDLIMSQIKSNNLKLSSKLNVQNKQKQEKELNETKSNKKCLKPIRRKIF